MFIKQSGICTFKTVQGFDYKDLPLIHSWLKVNLSKYSVADFEGTFYISISDPQEALLFKLTWW